MEGEIHLNVSMEDPAVLEVRVQLSPELASQTLSGSLGYRFGPVPVRTENMPGVYGLLYMQ